MKEKTNAQRKCPSEIKMKLYHFYTTKNGKNLIPENPVLKEILKGILLVEEK